MAFREETDVHERTKEGSKQPAAPGVAVWNLLSSIQDQLALVQAVWNHRGAGVNAHQSVRPGPTTQAASAFDRGGAR